MSQKTPLHQLLEDEAMFFLRGDDFYSFKGQSPGSSGPEIIAGSVRIPSTRKQNFMEIERAFISAGDYSAGVQKTFLERIFSNSFYEMANISHLQEPERIVQYVLAEAMPALILSYSSLLGISIKGKKNFVDAQDMVFESVGILHNENIEDEQVLRDLFRKAVEKIETDIKYTPSGLLEGKDKSEVSILSQITGGIEIFGMEGSLFRLCPGSDESVNIRLDGRLYGLKRIGDNGTLNQRVLNIYERAFHNTILSRTLKDQKEYIEDLMPRARLGAKFRRFVSDLDMEFGEGDVKVGAKWIEKGLRVGHFRSTPMILYIQTPLMFIRGVKVRPGEYDHLPKESGLKKNELLFWEYPPNKVCIFVNTDYSGDLYITTPALMDFVKHTGISGSLQSGYFGDTREDMKYHVMCGVRGGMKQKPLGQDAVDLMGVALNYFRNGISPETVRRHSGGAGFTNKYDDCFPVGKGYTEAQVDQIISERASTGKITWKGNHMHLPDEGMMENAGGGQANGR